jgi:hypothetical protein
MLFTRKHERPILVRIGSYVLPQTTCGQERLAYLNFRYLVAVCYRLGHPLRERLGVLGALNMGRYIKGYSDVLSLDIVPSESFTRHELPVLLDTLSVDGHMEKKLAISGAPRVIDCGVRIWCFVHFLYG